MGWFCKMFVPNNPPPELHPQSEEAQPPNIRVTIRKLKASEKRCVDFIEGVRKHCICQAEETYSAGDPPQAKGFNFSYSLKGDMVNLAAFANSPN